MVDLARQIVCTALGNCTYMLCMIFCLCLHLQDIIVSWSQPWSIYRKYPLWNPSVSMQSSWVAITSSVVSRSDKYLAGLILFLRQNIPLWDLWKWGQEGLTRGSGMLERRWDIWTLSAPVTLWHMFAMHCLIDCKYTTSEQHKSLELLFTETWPILIFRARYSTV